MEEASTLTTADILRILLEGNVVLVPLPNKIEEVRLIARITKAIQREQCKLRAIGISESLGRLVHSTTELTIPNMLELKLVKSGISAIVKRIS
jgi:hypothetical protein